MTLRGSSCCWQGSLIRGEAAWIQYMCVSVSAFLWYSTPLKSPLWHWVTNHVCAELDSGGHLQLLTYPQCVLASVCEIADVCLTSAPDWPDIRATVSLHQGYPNCIWFRTADMRLNLSRLDERNWVCSLWKGRGFNLHSVFTYFIPQ